MNEHGLTRRVRNWLKDQPDLWWLKVHGHDGQRTGVPDFLLCVRGVFAAVELKSPEATGADAEPTPAQAFQMRGICLAGGTVACCRSLEDVVRVVEEIREKVGNAWTGVVVNTRGQETDDGEPELRLGRKGRK